MDMLASPMIVQVAGAFLHRLATSFQKVTMDSALWFELGAYIPMTRCSQLPPESVGNIKSAAMALPSSECGIMTSWSARAMSFDMPITMPHFGVFPVGCPVFSITLYFGLRNWSLPDCLNVDFVSDITNT